MSLSGESLHSLMFSAQNSLNSRILWWASWGQGLEPHTCISGGTVSITDQGIKIHARCGQKKKKKPKCDLGGWKYCK